MAAMTAFRANRWRIKAAVDERFFGKPLFKITFFDSLSRARLARLSRRRIQVQFPTVVRFDRVDTILHFSPSILP
jgi:hypothetical protein